MAPPPPPPTPALAPAVPPDGTVMPDGGIIVNGVEVPNPGPMPMPKGPTIAPDPNAGVFRQATPIQNAKFVTHSTPGVTNPLVARIATVRPATPRGGAASAGGLGLGGRPPAAPAWATTQRVTHVTPYMNPLAARVVRR